MPSTKPARRWFPWEQMQPRVMGGFLTMPTSTTLREITAPGLRVIAATGVLKAIKTAERIYRGVLEDAAAELIESGETWAEVTARSDLINPLELQRKIDAKKRKEYRRGWYRHVA